MSVGNGTGLQIRVLPERWAARVSAFVRSSGTAEEAAAEDRPQMVFSRVYLPTQMNFYSDFNIRSRHFRCSEIFFVQTDATDAIHAVVSLEGLRTAQKVANLSLIVARLTPGQEAAELVALLDQVLHEASKYSAVEKLRCTYVYDTSFQAPLGIRISNLLVHPPSTLPFFEEARIPNETGKYREAVLLAFTGSCGAPLALGEGVQAVPAA